MTKEEFEKEKEEYNKYLKDIENGVKNGTSLADLLKYQKEGDKFGPNLDLLQKEFAPEINLLQKKIDEGEDTQKPRIGGCTIEGTDKFYKHFASKSFSKIPKKNWMISSLCFGSGNTLLKTIAFNERLQKSIRSSTNFIQVNLDDDFMVELDSGDISGVYDTTSILNTMYLLEAIKRENIIYSARV